MPKKLRTWLRKHGATNDEIDRAQRDGTLTLLAIERQLRPVRTRYDFDAVVERSGVQPESARRLWRALGFADAPAGAVRFDDEDVEALRTLREQLFTPLFAVDENLDGLMQQVRVVGAALARIAEVQSDRVVGAINEARAAGLGDEEVAETVATAIDWPRIAALLDYTMRLQLREALRRKLTAGDPGDPGARALAVGFVDLVGYTALSQELDASELAGLVDRFVEIAYDTVAEHEGRVVKTIGDEVMFVADDAGAAVRIALLLTERSAVDDLLPEARAGVAWGTVVALEGDYYGPVVNLARRMVELARPGSVLASAPVHEELRDRPGMRFQRLRSRRIRDIGRVEVWRARTARHDRLARTDATLDDDRDDRDDQRDDGAGDGARSEVDELAQTE